MTVCDDTGREAALEALDVAWGTAYDIGVSGGLWRARRADGTGGEIAAATPAGLDAAISADWAASERS